MAWWKNLFPSLAWLRRYDRGWFRPDLVAGITLAAFLWPAALADVSLAGLPVQAGFYACAYSGLVFWLFCSSKQTVISVTSAISFLVASSLGGKATRFVALASRTAAIAFTARLVRAGASKSWSDRAWLGSIR